MPRIAALPSPMIDCKRTPTLAMVVAIAWRSTDNDAAPPSSVKRPCEGRCRQHWQKAQGPTCLRAIGDEAQRTLATSGRRSSPTRAQTIPLPSRNAPFADHGHSKQRLCQTKSQPTSCRHIRRGKRRPPKPSRRALLLHRSTGCVQRPTQWTNRRSRWSRSLPRNPLVSRAMAAALPSVSMVPCSRSQCPQSRTLSDFPTGPLHRTLTCCRQLPGAPGDRLAYKPTVRNQSRLERCVNLAGERVEHAPDQRLVCRQSEDCIVNVMSIREALHTSGRRALVERRGHRGKFDIVSGKLQVDCKIVVIVKDSGRRKAKSDDTSSNAPTSPPSAFRMRYVDNTS